MKKLPGPRLIGIIGYPLGHSLSPAMHNAAFQYLNLDYCYLPFSVEPEQLPIAVQGLKALNIVGCNVTIPYKEQIIPLLDALDPQAKTLGAVNTIVNRDGELRGYNTDGFGFLRSLTEELKLDVSGEDALILGGGGAARAVAFALAEANVKTIKIANRNIAKAQRLANDIRDNFDYAAVALELSEGSVEKALANSTLLINTLPLGMYPQVEGTPPIKEEWLQPPLIVCDLIYNPLETKLLQMAKKNGCQTLNGEGMLIYQGAEAFRLWTGYEGPVEEMRKVLRRHLYNPI